MVPWLALGLLCLGCREDHLVLASPHDGGTGGQAPCIPIALDASIAQAGEGPVRIIGAPLPRIGHLAGCNEPVALQDAGDCSNPSDLSNCRNPFYSAEHDPRIADTGTPSLEQFYGPCACELGDAGTN